MAASAMNVYFGGDDSFFISIHSIPLSHSARDCILLELSESTGNCDLNVYSEYPVHIYRRISSGIRALHKNVFSRYLFRLEYHSMTDVVTKWQGTQERSWKAQFDTIPGSVYMHPSGKFLCTRLTLLLGAEVLEERRPHMRL